MWCQSSIFEYKANCDAEEHGVSRLHYQLDWEATDLFAQELILFGPPFGLLCALDRQLCFLLSLGHVIAVCSRLVQLIFGQWCTLRALGQPALVAVADHLTFGMTLPEARLFTFHECLGSDHLDDALGRASHLDKHCRIDFRNLKEAACNILACGQHLLKL